MQKQSDNERSPAKRILGERIAEILRGIQTNFDHFAVHQGTVQQA